MSVKDQKNLKHETHNDIETGVSFVINAKRKAGVAEIWICKVILYSLGKGLNVCEM